MVSSDEVDVGRPALSRDRIVGVALDLARSEGLPGISMRKIAGKLGVEAMSLYYHVPSKAALLVLMADRSIAMMPAPDVSLPWDEQLVQLLEATFLAAVDNPALFPVLSAEPLHPDALPTPTAQTGPSSLGLLEQVLALLETGAVPQAMRAHVFRGLLGIVIGFVVGQVDGLLPPPVPAQKAARGATSPPAIVVPPLLTKMRVELDAANPVDALRCNLQLLIHSLKTPRTGNPGSPTPTDNPTERPA